MAKRTTEQPKGQLKFFTRAGCAKFPARNPLWLARSELAEGIDARQKERQSWGQMVKENPADSPPNP